MLEIPVGKNHKAIVDDSDYRTLSAYSWSLDKDGYAHGYAHVNSVLKRVFMHRYILSAQPGEIVDHIDRNRLNNTRQNLRVCNSSLNQANRSKNFIRKYGEKFKGVYWRPEKKAFVSSIRINGKFKYLGLFKDENSAAQAYNQAAQSIFGDFACLNKVA